MLQTMRAAFWRDCWLSVGCLAIGWLLFQDVTRGGRFSANSNIVLVALVGWFGWQMHDRLFLMRLGPYPVLTPGLERSTMLACLVLVSSVALVGAVFCWWFGNRMPAVGPGVLLAAATLTGVDRLRATRIVRPLMQFGAFGVVLMAVAGHEHLLTVARYAEWLSDPGVQFGSLAAAALVCTLRKPVGNRAFLPIVIVPASSEPPFHEVHGGLGPLRNTVAAMQVVRPDGGGFSVVAVAAGSFLLALLLTAVGSDPANANVVVLCLLAAAGGVLLGRRPAVTSRDSSLRQTVIGNVALSARGLVYMFLLALLLWVLQPDLPGFAYRLIALAWLILLVNSTTAESDIESRMTRDWMLGVTDSRLGLGRRCVAFDVVGVISWLPAGMVGVVIQGTLLDVQGNTILVILLLGLIAAFAMIVLRCWTLGRLSDGWQFCIEILTLLLLLAGVFAMDLPVLGLMDYAVLVLAALVTGVLAVEIGGRGLARAKILASTVD